MASKFFRMACAITLASVIASDTFAQTTPPVLYRLGEASSYSEGCLPPCTCRFATYDDLFGTFTLRSTGSDPQGNAHFAVEQVNWILTIGAIDTRISGHGEYILSGPMFVRQRLKLDLSFDSAPAIHFDSGLQGASGSGTLSIDVAQNGFFCFDRIVSLVAAPVAANEISPYRRRVAMYDEGCFAPCDCPTQQLRTVGAFGLLDLRPTVSPAIRRYAVVNANWASVPTPGLPARSWTGLGIYSVDSANALHRLTLDLTDQSGVLRRYESGHVADTVAFPSIEIAVAVNGFYCFDYAFFLNAVP